MHRAERRFGAPATWLHRLRYRNIKDMPVSAYGAIVRAYELACQASEKAYAAERERVHAPDTKLIGLADFVVGKEGARVSPETSGFLVAPDETKENPK